MRTAGRFLYPARRFLLRAGASEPSGNRLSVAHPDLEAEFGAGVGVSLQILAAILTLPVVRSDQAILESRGRRDRAPGRRKAARERVADQMQGEFRLGAGDRLLRRRAPNADAVKSENLDELSLTQRRLGVPE